MPPGVDETISVYERAGVIGLLILLVVIVVLAFVRGWVIPGYVKSDLEKDRDGWKTVSEAIPEAIRGLTQELRESRLSGEVPSRRGNPR